MVQLKHNGETMEMNAKGDFEEVMSEFTEVCIAFLENVEESFDIDKNILRNSFVEAFIELSKMPNMYVKQEDDDLFM